MSCQAANTAEDFCDMLNNEALLELSSLIEHTLFERQRKELSSENTVVASFDDCF
jgi:hypothetical protein